MRIIAILLIGLFSLSSQAFETHHVPYMGADIQVRRMTFERGFGDNLLHHNGRQHNFFLGVKLADYIGIEGGFERAHTDKRIATLTTGDIAAGTPIVETISPVIFQSKGKVDGAHLNMMFYYKLCKELRLSLYGGIGIANYKAAFHRRTIQFGSEYITYSGFTRTTSKHKAILRLSGGLQGMLNKHLGLRLGMNWLNTAKIVAKGNDGRVSYPPIEFKLKNSLVYTAGVIWVF